MRCLVLTPDPRFAQALIREAPDDLSFLPVADAAAAVRLLSHTQAGSAVLDSATPAPIVAEFLRFWRANPERAAQPLIFATAEGTVGTNHGGVMRLPAGARRSDRTPPAVARALTQAAPLILDPDRRELCANDVRVPLTRSESGLLSELCRARVPIPTADLSRAALGYADAGGSAVRTHLSNLRRKCVRAGWPDPIASGRGRGYEAVGVRLLH